MARKLIISPVFLVAALLFWVSPVQAITLGVSKFNVRSGLDAEENTDYFQSELMGIQGVQIRDRNAIQDVMDYMSKCSSGVVSCDDVALEDMNLQQLDIIVFGDISRRNDGYMASVRAVWTDQWTVAYSGSLSGSSREELLEDLAYELGEKLEGLTAGGADASARNQDSRYRYRIAIHRITNGNKAAQKVDVSGVLDSILITAFGKSESFQVVERSRIQDLLQEKSLAMSGLVQTNRQAFEARGITHYLTGTLKVHDNVRVLAYQIINVKTGMPAVSDIFEWVNEEELVDAMKYLAEQSEEVVVNVNGKLNVADCGIRDVRILMKEDREDAFPNELGLCPLVVEDVPKGKYKLIFTHDQRDTLVRDIEIKPQETTHLKNVELPPISMDLFYEANSMEQSGNYMAAIKTYKKFYEKYPKYVMAPYAMYRIGFIRQVYLKDFKEGRQILQEVIRRNPGNADVRTEAYYGIALGYQEEGKKEDSKQILKMLSKEYPASTAAMQATVCLDMGKCPL